MLGNMVYNIDIETCSFSLNYAFIHVFCCVAQYILHVRVGRCQHFAVSHAFALFALTMDYGFSYMKNGSRTLSYRNPDDEHLGPLGTFLFFFWFDYSAFGIIIWAKEIETKIQYTETEIDTQRETGIVTHPERQRPTQIERTWKM